MKLQWKYTYARARVRVRVVINLEKFRKYNRGRSRYLWARILYSDNFSVHGDIIRHILYFIMLLRKYAVLTLRSAQLFTVSLVSNR